MQTQRREGSNPGTVTVTFPGAAQPTTTLEPSSGAQPSPHPTGGNHLNRGGGGGARADADAAAEATTALSVATHTAAADAGTLQTVREATLLTVATSAHEGHWSPGHHQLQHPPAQHIHHHDPPSAHLQLQHGPQQQPTASNLVGPHHTIPAAEAAAYLCQSRSPSSTPLPPPRPFSSPPTTKTTSSGFSSSSSSAFLPPPFARSPPVPPHLFSPSSSSSSFIPLPSPQRPSGSPFVTPVPLSFSSTPPHSPPPASPATPQIPSPRRRRRIASPYTRSSGAMSRPSRNQGPPAAAAATTRQNEYFVPRDGIDREVISADICRYLGNDALVRPGHYEVWHAIWANPTPPCNFQEADQDSLFSTEPSNRPGSPGLLHHRLQKPDHCTIQSFPSPHPLGARAKLLTVLSQAMIEDLKADSARWDSERRAQTSRNTSGGINTSRDAKGVPARHTSNSPVVQYRYSETHQSRQHHGPTDNAYPDPYARDPGYEGPRYPGSGAPGYTGAIGSYPSAAQQQQQQQQQQQPGYGPSSGAGYGNYQSPPADPRYAQSQGSSMYQGQDGPYISAGANMPVGYASPNDPYGPVRTGSSASGPQQPLYPTSGPAQSGYPTPVSGYPYGSQGPSAASQQAYAAVQPHDPFYGRASPAGQPSQAQQAFAPQGQQAQQQYDTTPHSRNAPAAATSAQAPPAGANARRNDREADRHSTDRHHRPSRR
ncbi:hypothetical protein S40288_02016 [Stachybotrys chartarum IBT 40288]|nr:hypothetical protein S40288_02016 [Stachybotrys chartarum IBT 40288]